MVAVRPPCTRRTNVEQAPGQRGRRFDVLFTQRRPPRHWNPRPGSLGTAPVPPHVCAALAAAAPALGRGPRGLPRALGSECTCRSRSRAEPSRAEPRPRTSAPCREPARTEASRPPAEQQSSRAALGAGPFSPSVQFQSTGQSLCAPGRSKPRLNYKLVAKCD